MIWITDKSIEPLEVFKHVISCDNWQRLISRYVDKLTGKDGFAYRDQAFPRLGQMFLDYDPPMKKLSEEFVPHSRVGI